MAVALEGHGREEEVVEGADLSRTVGWFTTLFPFAWDVPGGEDWRPYVAAVKRGLRAVPHKGLGYGVLRHLRADAPLGRPLPDVSFNYVGRSDGFDPGFYGSLLEDTSAAQGGAGVRAHLLDVVCGVQGDRLTVGVSYATAVHERADIERFTARLGDLLRDLMRQRHAEVMKKPRPAGARGGLSALRAGEPFLFSKRRLGRESTGGITLCPPFIGGACSTVGSAPHVLTRSAPGR